MTIGCYGNDPYDKYLKAQQDKYWGCDDEADTDKPTQQELREAAMEAREDARREER